MTRMPPSRSTAPALAVLVLFGCAGLAGAAQAQAAGTSTSATPDGAPSARKASPYRPQRLTERARTFYAAAWGLDGMKVSSTSSGNLIRFSYRVSDPARARELVRKQAVPYLVGQRNNVVLQVPVLDNIGQMRQTAPLQAGQEYWMVFSNKGNLVRRGDRVNINIGMFHADGLLVE